MHLCFFENQSFEVVESKIQHEIISVLHQADETFSLLETFVG